MDEVVAAEAYMELFLRRLTEPALVGIFLRFTVASCYDSKPIVASLINRLSSNAMVSTSLPLHLLSFITFFDLLSFQDCCNEHISRGRLVRSNCYRVRRLIVSSCQRHLYL